METASLYFVVIAGVQVAVAVCLAVWAMGKAASALREARGLRDELARRANNSAQEQQAQLDVLRRQVADLASGRALQRDMVLEGRLWGDMSTAQAVSVHAAGAARFVDVRSPGETSLGVIPGALLIPVEQLEERWREVPRDGKALIVYCASGGRSAAACEFLASKGFDSLTNLDAGYSGWNGPRAKP